MALSRADIEREVRYVAMFLKAGEFVACEPEEKIEAAIDELIYEFNVLANNSHPLRSAECGVVTISRRKTAALLVDRVWDAETVADIGISFGWELPMEVRLRAAAELLDFFQSAPAAPARAPVSRSEIDVLVAGLERDLALGIQAATGSAVRPLYSSFARRNAQYRSGDQSALVCVIDDLNIVNEEQLTWEQVVEFRRDDNASTAYRHFVHWLDKEMIDKPIHYIADEIARRLEGYEWALRKHGIKTLIGSLGSTLNPKSLISTSAAGLAVDIIAGKPIWSMLAAGGLLVGHAAVSLATALVERRDIEMSAREISYVQQIKADLGATD